MFEQHAEGFWVALFLALVLYSIFNTVTVPWRVKRFYANLNFNNEGGLRFDVSAFAESQLLRGQMTKSLYRGDYQGNRVEQFAAFSTQRRKFTLNRITRKRNQKVWTITIVVLDDPLPTFCARPTFVPEAPEYMLQNDAVLFPDDAEFAKRMHVVAPDHQEVRKLLDGEVKSYLTGLDPVSLEVVASYLIHRRPREPHDSGAALQKDLNAAVMLTAALSNKVPAATP